MAANTAAFKTTQDYLRTAQDGFRSFAPLLL
jgi:hypothetical protein